MSQAQSQSIIPLLTTSKIIPQVLPESISLNGNLEISFPEHTLVPGEAIPRSVTKNEPTVRFVPYEGDVDESKDYTIFMVDPDLLMPNDQIGGQVLHWYQPGVKFQGTTATFAAHEGHVVRYLECAPGPGPQHRYVFILTSGPSTPSRNHPLPSSAKNDLKDRMKFNVANFISENGLEVVGVSFMTVGPDLEGLGKNLALGVEAVYNKVTGQ